MLDNTISIDVNHDNDDGTTGLQTIEFSRFEEFQNRSVYIASNHTLASRNLLTFFRTQPKQSGNFRGVAKSAVKLTEDFLVDGVDATTANVSPGIIEIGFSFPVGMTDAQILDLRMRAAALLLMDDFLTPLTTQLMV